MKTNSTKTNSNMLKKNNRFDVLKETSVRRSNTRNQNKTNNPKKNRYQKGDNHYQKGDNHYQKGDNHYQKTVITTTYHLVTIMNYFLNCLLKILLQMNPKQRI